MNKLRAEKDCLKGLWKDILVTIHADMRPLPILDSCYILLLAGTTINKLNQFMMSCPGKNVKQNPVETHSTLKRQCWGFSLFF